MGSFSSFAGSRFEAKISLILSLFGSAMIIVVKHLAPSTADPNFLQLPTLLLPRLLTLVAAAVARPNPSTLSVCIVGREETL
jgi:hypothetical protein